MRDIKSKKCKYTSIYIFLNNLPSHYVRFSWFVFLSVTRCTAAMWKMVWTTIWWNGSISSQVNYAFQIHLDKWELWAFGFMREETKQDTLLFILFFLQSYLGCGQWWLCWSTICPSSCCPISFFENPKYKKFLLDGFGSFGGNSS